MNLLPQVSPKNLDQRDLEGWDFAMHEDSSEIQLHLETHVHLKSNSGDCVRKSNLRKRCNILNKTAHIR